MMDDIDDDEEEEWTTTTDVEGMEDDYLGGGVATDVPDLPYEGEVTADKGIGTQPSPTGDSRRTTPERNNSGNEPSATVGEKTSGNNGGGLETTPQSVYRRGSNFDDGSESTVPAANESALAPPPTQVDDDLLAGVMDKLVEERQKSFIEELPPPPPSQEEPLTIALQLEVESSQPRNSAKRESQVTSQKQSLLPTQENGTPLPNTELDVENAIEARQSTGQEQSEQPLGPVYWHPPIPTWRHCLPVNIYVYRNGVENTPPTLVHIPTEKKKNLCTILDAVATRMKIPVGYPTALYTLDGFPVRKPYELQMYNNYVVVTNLERRFHCVNYGQLRGPLVVIGHDSKHVKTLKFKNKPFDLFCRRKMKNKLIHEMIANSDIPDGIGPCELSMGGKPCGVLCHKVKRAVPECPAECFSDEILVVEGAQMDTERDWCREDEGVQERNRCWKEAMETEKQIREERNKSIREQEELGVGLVGPPATLTQDVESKQGSDGMGKFNTDDCRYLIEELERQVGSFRDREHREQRGSNESTRVCPFDGNTNQHLIELMTRYKDVGSDIFKLFQGKIERDLALGGRSGGGRVSQRWMIKGGSSLSLNTKQRVTQELQQVIDGKCEFKPPQCPNTLKDNLESMMNRANNCKIEGNRAGKCSGRKIRKSSGGSVGGKDCCPMTHEFSRKLASCERRFKEGKGYTCPTGGKRRSSEGCDGVNIFQALIEARNPFQSGKLLPKMEKAGESKQNKGCIEENTLRQVYFHGESRNQSRGITAQNQFSSETSSARINDAEWWPPQRPPVQLIDKINDLLRKHDNAKMEPGDVARSAFLKESETSVGERTSATFVKKLPKRREVGAQFGAITGSEVSFEEELQWSSGSEKSPRWKPQCFQGGTQTCLQILPSEDECPAGMYEGYQTSLKSRGGWSEEESSDEEWRRERERQLQRKNRRERFFREAPQHVKCSSKDEATNVFQQMCQQRLPVLQGGQRPVHENPTIVSPYYTTGPITPRLPNVLVSPRVPPVMLASPYQPSGVLNPNPNSSVQLIFPPRIPQTLPSPPVTFVNPYQTRLVQLMPPINKLPMPANFFPHM